MLSTSDFKSSFAFRQGSMKLSSCILLPKGFASWFRVDSRVIAIYRCKVHIRKRHWGKILYFFIYRVLIVLFNSSFLFSEVQVSTLQPDSQQFSVSLTETGSNSGVPLKPLSQMVHSKSDSSLWIFEYLIQKVVPLQPFPWGALIPMALLCLAASGQAV